MDKPADRDAFIEERGAPSSPVEDSASTCCSTEGVCVNVGVLGHVDSGKTSLCRGLSEIISTCGLDKHPQSRQRGITLDLGFSAFSFTLPVNPHLCSIESVKNDPPRAEDAHGDNSASAAQFASRPLDAEGSAVKQACGDSGGQIEVQVCLVDCPGHASLVKTVIGGSHIIDAAMLVVDATKGVQAQTAECIVICQVIRKPILVVLNKIDLIPVASRQQKVTSLTGKMKRLLEGLGFGSEVPVVALSAVPSDESDENSGLDNLKEALGGLLLARRRSPEEKVLPRKTVPRVGGEKASCLLLEALNRQRCLRCLCCLRGGFAGTAKVPVLFLSDHAFTVKGKGTVVTGTVLRGRVAVGDTVTLLSSATAGVVASAAKVKSIQRFRKDAPEARAGQRAAVCLAGGIDTSNLVESGNKFHCTVGHLTVIATVNFFRRLSHPQGSAKAQDDGNEGVSELTTTFDSSLVYEEVKSLTQENPQALALLSFDRPVLAPVGSVLLGSRLDVEASLSLCRLAFEGSILRPVALVRTGGNLGSACATSHFDRKGFAPPEAKQRREDVPKRQSAAPEASVQATAETTPLPSTALCVIRRKWRVGIAERFIPDGSSACTCGRTPAPELAGAVSKCNAMCGFRSSSLVVRGLFDDSQHARRFAGFRVALLQCTKEEAERQLERGEGGALYGACLSVCLPSLATLPILNPDGCSSLEKIPCVRTGCNNGSGQPMLIAHSDRGETEQAVSVWPALLTSAFGGKGKSHIELAKPLTCEEISGCDRLGKTEFCVVLMYCKNCFDKHQSLFQP